MNPSKIPNLSRTLRAEPVHVRPCHGPCGQSDARSHRWSPYRRRWHGRRWECQCRVRWHPGQLKQVKKNSAEASPKESEIWESQKVPSLKVGSELYPLYPPIIVLAHPSFLRASVATINRNSPLRNCSKVLKRDSWISSAATLIHH